MLLVDANVFLAYANNEDVHHARAIHLLSAVEKGKYGVLFTTDYVFNEVVGVTFRKRGKEQSVKIGETILKSTVILNIDDHQLQEAWRLFTKTQLKLNLVDCTNLIAMKIANTDTIATFDEEFKKVANVIS